MTLRAAVLALALSGLAASAACAEPLFDAYQALCVKTAAQPDAVLAAADGAGWQPIPDAMLQQLGSGIAVQSAQGRMKSDSAGLTLMVVGHKELPLGGMTANMRFCAVATTSPVDASLAGDFAAWAAVPAEPGLSAAGRNGYVFTDNGGAHAVVAKPGDSEAKDLLRSGRANVAVIQEGKGLNLLAFAVPTM